MKQIFNTLVGIVAVGTSLACAMPVAAQSSTFEPIKNTFGDIVPEQGIYTELSEFTLQLSSAFQYDDIYVAGTKKVSLIDEETSVAVTTATVTPGTGKVQIKLDVTVTEPGHYILLVPEDALNWEDDQGNSQGIQEMRFRLWVEKNEFEPISNRIATIDPEQGKYSELETFNLTFSSAFAGNYIEGSYSTKITLKNEDTEAVVATATVKAGTAKVTLTLDSKVTEPGHYILDIPEGALFYDDDPYGLEDIAALQFRYWVEKSEEPPVEEFEPIANRIATIDPEQGKYSELETFNLTFSNAFAGSYIEGSLTKKITLKNEDTDAAVATATVKPGTAKVTLTLDSKITEPGHYILDIPEGALWYDDDMGYGSEDVAAMQFRYWVEKSDVPPVEEFEPITNTYATVTPEQGTYETLNEITVQFGSGYASDRIYAGTKKVTLVDEKTGDTAATFSVLPGTGKVTLVLDNEFNIAGHYLLTIPEDALGYDDDWDEWNSCPAMQFRYWVTGPTGVAEIEAAVAERADVYSIAGIRVLKDATVDDLKNLPAGIYIRAGRKIAIK